MITVIYSLNDPRSGEAKYVGRTKNPRQRLIGLYALRRPGDPLSDWIGELRSLGLRPMMTELERCPSSVADLRESNWIATLRPTLLNRADYSAPTSSDRRETSGAMMQVRMSRKDIDLYSRAAASRGLNLSALVRLLFTEEVDRLRATGADI